MAIHQLAVFWRAALSRCFTSWHFSPAPKERAAVRAEQILTTLQQFTTLQIYGAALNDAPLPLTEAHPAPADEALTTRLQVDLFPAKALQPTRGISYIKFSIPGPLEELMDAVESKQFDHQYWRTLEQEVFPFLRLPDGTPVKKGSAYLYRAEIAYLDNEHRPQPHYPPIEAAINRTTEDLKVAQQSYKKLKTTDEARRVEKYQTRLDYLYSWQQIEKGCFDQIDSLTLRQLDATLLKKSRRAAPAATASHDPELLPIAAAPNIDGEATSQPLTLTTIQPQAAPLAPAMARESTSTPTPAIAAETSPMSEPININQQEGYLPALPAPQQASAWTDLPPAHFSDPSMWRNGSQLRQQYGLTERSYFRWIEDLSKYGLYRSLVAAQDKKIRLFYWPDVAQAVSRAIADADSAALAGRGRKKKLFSTIPASGAPLAQTTTATNAGALLTQAPSSQTSSSQTATMAAAHISSSIAQTAALQWQSGFAALAAQQADLAREVAALNSKLDAITAAVSHHSTATNNNELLARLVDLVAAIASNNATNQKLLSWLENPQLNSMLSRKVRASSLGRSVNKAHKLKTSKPTSSALKPKVSKPPANTSKKNKARKATTAVTSASSAKAPKAPITTKAAKTPIAKSTGSTASKNKRTGIAHTSASVARVSDKGKPLSTAKGSAIKARIKAGHASMPASPASPAKARNASPNTQSKPQTQAHSQGVPFAYSDSISVSQAAFILKIDVTTVRRWCEAGKLKAMKIDKQWRIDQNSLTVLGNRNEKTS